METKHWELKDDPEGAIAQAAKLIAAGEVVAFPTETVYGLGADGWLVFLRPRDVLPIIL